MIGSFLFATHTTVCSGILWYQIPRYLLVELPGLKNPSAKISPFEIRRSPSLMVWLVFKDSRDVQDEKWSNIIREKSRNSFSASMMRQPGPWLLDKWNVACRQVWQKKLFWDTHLASLGFSLQSSNSRPWFV